MSTIVVGKQMRRLVPADFEQRLLEWNLCRESGDWQPWLTQDGICFDLRRVECVDLGCLVQLALLIEGMLRDGVAVELCGPLAEASPAEAQFMRAVDQSRAKLLRRRIDRRANASRYLQRAGLEDALRVEHIQRLPGCFQAVDSISRFPEGQLSVDIDVRIGDPDEEVDASFDVTDRQLFPLTWLPLAGDEWQAGVADQPALQQMAMGIVGTIEATIGVSTGQPGQLDGQKIANVILAEFVDNVVKHSGGCQYGLLAASVQGSESLPSVDTLDSCDRAYFEWFSQAEAPLLQIFFGDSGIGIIQSLRDVYRRQLNSNHDELQPARIIQWALTKWATSQGATAEPIRVEATSGLYKIDNLVRDFNGMITVRTGDQIAGRDHGGPGYDLNVVATERHAQLPGCFHRVRIPLSRKLERFWRPNRATGEGETEFLFLGSLVGEGLSPNDTVNLISSFNEPAGDRRRNVVAVFPPMEDSSVPRVGVLRALEQMSVLPQEGTLILLAPPGGWDVVRNAVNELNARQRGLQERELGREIVLVVGDGSKFAWLGVSDATARFLCRLLESGSLPVSSVAECCTKDDDPESVIRELQRDGDWVAFEKNQTLRLRRSLSDVAAAAERRLGECLEGGVAETRGKYFLSPSLVLLKSWLLLKDIVPNAHDLVLAAFSLALKVREHRKGERILEASHLLCDTRLDREVSRELQRFLGVKGMERLSAEAEEPPLGAVSPEIQKDSTIIIFCDILYSGETGERFAKQVVRDHATPLAVICFVDGRQEDRKRGKSGDRKLQVYGEDIPIISLTELDLVATDAEEQAVGDRVAYIDPIQFEEESELLNSVEGAQEPEVDDLLPMVERTQALFLGHIGKSMGRHFTLFLDAQPLLEFAPVRRTYLEKIEKWLNEVSEKQGKWPASCAMWYPEHPDQTAVKGLADWLRAELSAGKSKKRAVRVEVMALQRRFQETRYTFSRRQWPRRQQDNVVIIDWGAMTGSSIQHMLRLAVENGAVNVFACIMVSQLTLDDHEFFQNIRVLKGTSRTENASVRVEFMHRFQFGYYWERDCPLCRQGKELREGGYPTEFLAKFAARQVENCELVDREEVGTHRNRTIDDRRLPMAALTWIARFRACLAAAQTCTQVRKRVLDKLLQMERGTTNANWALWMLHFLNVETQWLRKPPLHFDALRKPICKLARSVALDGSVEAAFRKDAIDVLRMTSKRSFAKAIEHVFSSVYQSPDLVAHLLHNAFTYVTRPYHQNAHLLRPAAESLRAIEKDIVDGAYTVDDGVSETVRLLSRQALREVKEVELQKDALPDVWRGLQDRFREYFRRDVDHLAYEEDVRLMSPGPYLQDVERLVQLLDLGVRPAPPSENAMNYLGGLNNLWSRRCSRFLDEVVLPHLVRLRPVLESYEAQQQLGEENVRKLLQYSVEAPTVAQTTFSKLVENLSKRSLDTLNSRTWKHFVRERKWLYDTIFGNKPKESLESALWKFLHLVPTELIGVLSRHLGEYQRISHPDQPELENVVGWEQFASRQIHVFCTGLLLDDALRQVFGNVKKHRSGDQSPEVRIQMEEAKGSVRIIIMNNRTTTAATEGYGIRTLRQRLKAFQGKVVAGSRHGNDWGATYSVALELLVWSDS